VTLTAQRVLTSNQSTDSLEARWIIEAKFDQPRQQRRQIERTRLLDQLLLQDAGPIIVQAPAGFGKSTLLGQWVRAISNQGTAVAWLNLDEDDRQVEQFIAYLITTLRRCLGVDTQREAAFSIYSGLPPKVMLAAVLNEIAVSGRKIALVLDDYHRAESEEVDAILRGFIERAAPTIRIAIASRSLPRLGLARLKADNRVMVVTDRDLRFNAGETSLFFASDMPADKQGWSRFAVLAEGWPVALQFARMWLGEGGTLSALGAASEINDLGAYLSEQVFEALPRQEQEFLLLTSPLEIISAEIAEAIGVRNAAARVRDLSRSALPITVLSPEPMRFRYHHLLQDFLLSRARTEAVDLAAIHRRAARWFSASGNLASAVRHALAGADPAFAAAILDQAGGWRLVYSGQGHLRAILRSVHRLLDPAAGTYSRLVLGVSVMAAKSGDLATATTLFRQVANREASSSPALDDEVRIIDALIRLYCDQPLGKPALEALVELAGRLTANDPISLALATNLVAFFMLQKGDYQRARRFGERAIQHFHRAEAVFGELHLYAHIGAAELATGNRLMAATTYRTMRDLCRRSLGEDSDLEAIADVLEAETAYEADERPEARQLLGPSLERIERGDSWFDVFAAGYVSAARLELADHGPAAAFAALERGRGTAEQRSMSRLSRLLDEETIRTATLSNDLDRAEAACHNLGLSLSASDARMIAEPITSLRGDGPALIVARLLIAKGRAADATAFLDAANEQIQRSGAPMTRRITARVLKALAENALGRPDLAMPVLTVAVRLVASERFARTLLDEGDRCRDLLVKIAASETIEPAWRDRIAQLLHRNTATAPPPDKATADPGLSARERQILAFLAEGLSNKEIARRVELDPNTVKYHLKRLFTKLSVERRARAVIRARQYGLID
jgi:LuxR family maltose regulon positive regulatory protein